MSSGQPKTYSSTKISNSIAFTYHYTFFELNVGPTIVLVCVGEKVKSIYFKLKVTRVKMELKSCNLNSFRKIYISRLK